MRQYKKRGAGFMVRKSSRMKRQVKGSAGGHVVLLKLMRIASTSGNWRLEGHGSTINPVCVFSTPGPLGGFLSLNAASTGYEDARTSYHEVQIRTAARRLRMPCSGGAPRQLAADHTRLALLRLSRAMRTHVLDGLGSVEQVSRD
eukprot:2552014-Prymnesium_polylepis.1